MKTILLSLCAALACGAFAPRAQAQAPAQREPTLEELVAARTNAPPATNAATKAAVNSTNRDVIARQMLRDAISNATAGASNAPIGAPPGALTAPVAVTPAAATNVVATPFPAFPAPPARRVPAALPTPQAPANPNFPGPPTNVANRGLTQAPDAAPDAANAVPGADAGANKEEEVPLINFQAMPLPQFFDFYANLVGRTVLHTAQLPDLKITLKATTQLSRKEAIQACESVLVINGYTMVPLGEKFVTFVQNQAAIQEGSQFSSGGSGNLPEAIQFVTQIVRLEHAKPSEVVPVIQPFAKNPAGIIPIDSSQMIVLRDYAVNVKRMLELIAKVDVVPEIDYTLTVIPIKFGKVEDIYDTMNSLISGSGGGGAPRAPRASRTGTRGVGGVGGAGGLNGAPNAFGATGGINPAGGVNGAGGAGGRNSFAGRLNQIVSRAGQAELQILSDARIVPDSRSNSLIVYGNKQDLQMISNIVSKVDVLLAQVLIEAIIMDVSITDSRNLGVSAVQSPKQTGKLTSAGGSNNGNTFLSQLSSVTNFSSSVPGGFSYLGNWGGNFDFALSAIATDDKARVLQTPRIQTSHAVPASFFNGETVPYVTSTYYGGFGTGPSSSYQQLQVGISLDVTPYITPDDLVVMEIEQHIDELSGSTTIAGVGDVPNTSSRSASSTISVRNHDTILLGGFVRTKSDVSKSGVPGLKDIPILGNLFRSKADSHERSELLILIRPTILPTPQDAALNATNMRHSLPGIREAEREFDDAEQGRQKKAGK